MIFNLDAKASPSTKKRSLISDPEFGEVVCKRSAQAKYVRLRVMEGGVLRATLPKRAPLYLVRNLLDSSRSEIRQLITEQKAKRISYQNGMHIGHSHTLSVLYAEVEEPQKKMLGQILQLTLPMAYKNNDDLLQAYVSKQVRATLKREAMAYLPRRLQHLAYIYGFHYDRERFGNQTGRWASCSSSGTISLNVALMNLPHDIIDYVLVHELAHTVEMNHSSAFWQLVEDCAPDYRSLRKILKTMSPIC